ncbi:MAG: hypothetical protein GF346_02350 [Candidatus Eisenbacteria bacterium]|nr:hypothetical protein [Candidatus Latescibacterota bacterium]MBD3301269.1 hypothetical protein [Candidatus Eisenbacteria bacterium]
MIQALFGTSSMASKLRRGLDETMSVHRSIADRIATARNASSESGFSEALQAGERAQRTEKDLVEDMSLLADTTIRYEVEARLLRGAYSSIRKAIGRDG